MTFGGFPTEAFTFFERLAADNSRSFWQANKPTYEATVRGPMLALLDELAEFGPFNIFRPYRDVRFAMDKTPYKENIGAYGESDGGAGYYVLESFRMMTERHKERQKPDDTCSFQNLSASSCVLLVLALSFQGFSPLLQKIW